MILLALAASVLMSVAALNDYRAGRLALAGTRIKGLIGGLFDNPNDLALHLVTMVPLAVCLMLGRRGLLKKLLYGLTALVMAATVVVTFSRGGFLGLMVASAVLAWKLARKNRVLVVALGAVALLAFVVAAPSEYGGRLSTIFGGDVTGSASARQELFWRSLHVSLRYPIFGVGLGNFHFKSLREQVSHNSYTQVSAEMGMAALAVYCLFMLVPFRRLRAIERETLGVKEHARYYYLAAGLQASLAGYMVSSFFASVAHLWYVYYLVGYAVCVRRLYALGTNGAVPGGARRAAGEAAQDADGGPAPRPAAAGGL
jgi:O-antigen ligase